MSYPPMHPNWEQWKVYPRPEVACSRSGAATWNAAPYSCEVPLVEQTEKLK
jgi:hypothetical protein